MKNVIVVSDKKDWRLDVPGCEVVTSRDYLASPDWAALPRARVYNLTRSYRYQRVGYYVSLLAEARGHRPLPSIRTIQDLKSQSVIRIVSDDLQDLINRSLASIQSAEFVLSVYFGRNVAQRHDGLARALHRRFPAPFLRAYFAKQGNPPIWTLRDLSPLSVEEIPEAHGPFVVQVTEEWFKEQPRARAMRKESAYDLALLYDPNDPDCPSNEKAIRRFTRAFEHAGFSVERVDKDDINRLAEFDALFLRQTTSVNHRTYRFACKAAAEGLVVIDDPDSILRCTNKVFLAELMARHGVPTPRTIIVQRGVKVDLVAELGLPVVLKQPDSAASRGVVKADTREELERELERLLNGSDLIVAQEFLPTQFDWRIGVLDRRPLYASQYFMAKEHWQIIKHDSAGDSYGQWRTLHVEEVPEKVIKTALKAANLFGDGLYGVDLKQKGKDLYVIEVNDNPSIDGGVEDQLLGEELYRRIAASFRRRVDAKKKGPLWS